MKGRLDVESPPSAHHKANREEIGTAATSIKVQSSHGSPKEKPELLSAMGLRVLVLLAVQNSSKNILLRFVMREKPKFLTSAAVIGSGTWSLFPVHSAVSLLITTILHTQSVQS